MKSKARPTQQLDVNRIFFPSFFFWQLNESILDRVNWDI